MKKGAIISDCCKYRYLLWRIWDDTKPLICYIGLNPSTADAEYDDRTIGRLIEFTKTFGYGGFYIGNLLPIRTKKPSILKAALKNDYVYNNDLINLIRENLRYLESISEKISLFVLCWGSNNSPEIQQAKNVMVDRFAKNSCCFGFTKDFNPVHPLYLKSDTVLVPFIWDYRKQNIRKIK